MKEKPLQFISLVITSLTLLYLLFMNIVRESFMVHGWL